MRNKMKKFLQILKIELGDIGKELKFLAKIHKIREKSGEITTYVFRENMNLIQNEISGLQSVIKSVDNLVSSQYKSFEEMVEDLDRKIQAKIKESNYADAVYELVKRKIDKVHSYITAET